MTTNETAYETAATPAAADPAAPAAAPGPISHEEQSKKRRRELYRQPEVVAAHALMILSAFATMFAGGPLLVVAILAAFGSALVVLTIMSGSHAMVMMSAGYLMLVLGVGIVSADLSAAWIAAGMSVSLLLTDLFRLNFARRRAAQVDPRLFVTTIGFTMLVALVAVASIAVGELVTSGEQRSWLWVPVATALIVVLFAVGAIAVARKPGSFDKRRYRPGERMLPQPTVD